MNANLGYTNTMFTFNKKPDWNWTYISPTPPTNNRGFVVIPVDATRYLACWIGYLPVMEGVTCRLLTTVVMEL